jgi:hypothetical protein
MDRAGISGPQATPKGLRHAFGIAMVTSENPLPLHILADLMGHSSTATTEIYTRILAGEKQKNGFASLERIKKVYLLLHIGIKGIYIIIWNLNLTKKRVRPIRKSTG